MSTTITPPAETNEEPKFDVAKFLSDRNARESAIRAGKEPSVVVAPESEKPDGSKPEEKPQKSDKPSGDMRRLMRVARENGELKARLEMLERAQKTEEKPAPVETEGKPERSKFATDQEHTEALTEWKAKQTTEAALKAHRDAQAQTAERKRISDQFGAQMKAASDPEKGGWTDWPELMKTSKAADVDIYAASPALFGAFLSSEFAKELMHEWLLKPEDLTFMIDTFKSDPDAGTKAFHRLEGRLAREAETREVPKKPEAKKEPEKKAAPEEKPKPKPSGAVRAPAGEGVPEEPEPGSKAWMEKRNSEKRVRGY